MRATAMQILFLRKMRSRMMMTSIMARIITRGGRWQRERLEEVYNLTAT